jgi:predicted dehydrogenase
MSTIEENQALTRRDFLRGTGATVLAAAAFPTIIPGSALGKNGAVAPSNRISLGLIGSGPEGRGVTSWFFGEKDCRLVAVCDVKTDQLELARTAVNKANGAEDCQTYHDFRDLVARKDIDACIIATPDHWHVLNALAAVNAGKDVYVEKPLAVSLEEDQALRKAVRKHKRVFQFGTWQRSGRMFWLACQLVRNGRIGKLNHINAWAPGSTPGGSRKVVAPPSTLDYDLWLGPVPFMPHTENRCSDVANLKTWWFTSQFALGFVAGWGIHPIDIALWGGGELLNGVVEVEGRGTFRNAEGVCDTATIWEVDYKFASGLTMKFVGTPTWLVAKPTDPWLHGDEWKAHYRRIESHGTAFEGSDGWVHVDRTGINLQPENLIDCQPDKLPVQLFHSTSHARNFLNCIKNRTDPVSSIDAAVAGDALCFIADSAIRLERPLKFDFKTERFLNDDAANQRLKARPMRKPWHL